MGEKGEEWGGWNGWGMFSICGSPLLFLLGAFAAFGVRRVVSCRVVSCRVVSCRVVSCLALSCLAFLSCLGVSDPFLGVLFLTPLERKQKTDRARARCG